MLKQDAVIDYLNELHGNYVSVTIDKVVNNIAIICKKCYVTVILKDLGILDARNKTYKNINTNQEEIIQDKLEYNTSLKLYNRSKDKRLPIVYWILKIHENLVKSRFIIASKSC